MADATKIFLLWAGTTGNIPAGWSHEAGFNDKFIRGSNAYGGGGGSNIHIHVISSPGCNPTMDTVLAVATGINIAHAVHVHLLSALACGNSTNLPIYRALIVISAAVATTTIPTSVIGIFESAPASGFSAYAAANSRYVRGGAAVANGGAATHTHTYAGESDVNDVFENVAAGIIPKAAHTHTHAVNIISTTGNWRPPGVKVLLHSSDSNQTMPVGLVAFFNGDPPAATWDIVSGVATNYYQRMLYADVAHGTTGASHGHAVSGPSAWTGPPSALTNIDEAVPVNTTTGDIHTHLVSCTLNSFAPLPIYIDVIFGKFKGLPPAPEVPANPLICKPLICPDIVRKAVIRYNTPSGGSGSGLKTLRPSGVGDETSICFQFPDSGAHWDKVKEDSADDDETYVYNGYDASGGLDRDLYALPAPEGSGTINKVTVHIRCSGSYGHPYVTGKTSIKTHDVVHDGDSETLTSGEWKDYFTEYVVNPETGEPWTWDEIDALQVGFVLQEAFPESLFNKCTQCYVEVDYTP